MKGSVKKFTLEGRECACFAPDSAGEGLPLAVLCGWGLEDQIPALAEGLPELLLFWNEPDGGRDFTPWPVPPIWEGEKFTGEGGKYLSFLTETALPYLEREFGASTDPACRALLGYSLGGLFSLWAMGKGAGFSAFASLSGSTWYEGFSEYLRAAPLRGTEAVYLSLGDREEFGGPPRMRAVGDCTREIYGELSARLPDVTLEWNKGGHGKGVQGRWRKALEWAARRIAPPEREGEETQ